MGEDEEIPEYNKWDVIHEMSIQDALPVQSGPSLGREGFVLQRAETGVKDFYDDAEVKEVYNAGVEKLVKDTTGADKVLGYDHTICVASDELRRERQVWEIVDLVHND